MGLYLKLHTPDFISHSSFPLWVLELTFVGTFFSLPENVLKRFQSTKCIDTWYNFKTPYLLHTRVTNQVTGHLRI